jgi:UDP-2-acetamido-2,6-beta-L-arabino-hexul-4-ose reductase
VKTVLITGSRGFIGQNLISALGRNNDISIRTFDIDDDPGLLLTHLREADFIYHFAGVNRPQNPAEFETGNAQSTASLVEILAKSGRCVPILLTSSIQAALDIPYGKSKKAAEDILIDYNKKTGAPIYLYRLPGVFGKWSRPNYNTVVATFCYNIARGLEISISDPNKEIELAYIDDVVRHFVGHLKARYDDKKIFYSIDRTYKVTLGELSSKIYSLRDMRRTLVVPDLSDDFMKCLYATYLSFLDARDFSYPLDLKTDNRGSLFELIKSEHFGQIFLSKTHTGIVRGNHYHDSKVEKFCVIQGNAVIRFRNILNDDVIEYQVSGNKIEVVDIPPGYTHHIENNGDGEMIVLFWANQIFDHDNPDTYFLQVKE